MRTLLLVCFLVAGLCCLLARDVFSQERDDVTPLVVVAYAESVHDRAAEWHVLKKRAAKAGMSLDQLMQRYVSVFKVSVQGQPRTKWLKSIGADCARPEGLPNAEVWSVAQCLQVRKDAEAFLQDALKNPCPDADHWGARDLETDAARAAKALKEERWALAHCSEPMSNAFYRVLK